MGKFMSKQRAYATDFDANVSVPALLFNQLSNVTAETGTSVGMPYGELIELLLQKKNKEIIGEKTEGISVFQILETLYPEKKNYLQALQEDKLINKNDIVLPKIVWSQLTSSKASTRAIIETDNRSEIGTEISAYLETKTITTNGTKKSRKDPNEKLNQALAKVVSPYRFALINTLKNLLNNQTDLTALATGLEITNTTFLRMHIFTLIHDILSEIKKLYSKESLQELKTTDQIFQERSFLLMEGGASRESCDIREFLPDSLQRLDDTHSEPKLGDLVQLYGYLFNALRSNTFLNHSDTPVAEFKKLGRQFYDLSTKIFENLFQDFLPVKVCLLVQKIQQKSYEVSKRENLKKEIKEMEISVYFYLLGKLISQSVINNKTVDEILSEQQNTDILNALKTELPDIQDSNTKKNHDPEKQIEFLECVVILFGEFTRQSLRLGANSGVDTGSIKNRDENKVIRQSLRVEIARIRAEITAKKVASSRPLEMITETDETESRGNTPLKPAASNSGLITESLVKALQFGDENTIPPTEATPDHHERRSVDLK